MKKLKDEILNKIKNGKIEDLEIILLKSKENPLSSQHLLEILKQIKNIISSKNRKSLLWQIALINGPTEEILDFANENIKILDNNEEYPSISDEMRFSIYYIFENSNKDDFEKTISRLLQSRSGEIHLIIAEHYFEKNQPERALSIIIEILDFLNIDHNVSDAIEMDISHYTNKQILENLKNKYKNDEKNISRGMKYVKSIMETAISKK